jgi:ABC-2 type transport system permease protein
LLIILRGEIQRVSLSLPSEPVSTAPINTLLTDSLIEQLGVEEPERFVTPFGPAGLEFVSLAEEAPGTPGTFSFAPFLVTIFIILPLWTSGDYLVRSVTQEKSSRVMEILLLSLQPKQLLAGKLIGFGALTFVQYHIRLGLLALTSAGIVCRADGSLLPGANAVKW